MVIERYKNVTKKTIKAIDKYLKTGELSFPILRINTSYEGIQETQN